MFVDARNYSTKYFVIGLSDPSSGKENIYVVQHCYCGSPRTTCSWNERALLQSVIPSGMCAKLRTVAASKNGVHMPRSLYYCLFAPDICMVLFFTHIPFVVNHTFNATPPERLQQRVGIRLI